VCLRSAQIPPNAAVLVDSCGRLLEQLALLSSANMAAGLQAGADGSNGFRLWWLSLHPKVCTAGSIGLQ
jgi:hypothetical protein